MYSREELEDLSVEFGVTHKEDLERLEGDIVEAGRRFDYDAYMDATNRLKKFCVAGGPGGRFYFDEMWKDDPVAARLKMERDGPVYSDVVTMLTERGPSESKDIYVLVEGANYKVLQSLIRKKVVLRLPESHIYYLPDQDVSAHVSKIEGAKEEARRHAEECQEGPVELTIPSTDEVLEKMFSKIEDGLREQGATEEQIDQVFGRKKKRGLFSLFRKKK